MYGDQHEGIELDLAKLLPSSVLNQYEMTTDMWEEKIRNWWANNGGMSREDDEEEFLCVAEELDMYGIQYYPIRVCLLFFKFNLSLGRINETPNCCWAFRPKGWAFSSRTTNFRRVPSSPGPKSSASRSRAKW